MFNAHNPPCHFVKFCRPEHNILNGCQTIRFGTLEYYRQLDPSSVLADSMEGRETTDIRIADSQNASPEVKEMFPLLKNRNVTIQNSKAGIQSPNCWVWCCSIIQKDFPNDSLKEFGKKLNKNYTSFYAIPTQHNLKSALCTYLINRSPVALFPASP